MEPTRRNTREDLQEYGTGLLDELLSFFESEASILDSQLLTTNNFSMPETSKFVSAIKFYGQPILPPVMTDQRYEEMAMYKRQAIFTETRLKARSRQKLLSRVQSIVDSMNRPTSLKQTPDETNVSSRSDTVSPPLLSSEPATDVTERPTSQQLTSQMCPDSPQLDTVLQKSTPPKVLEDLPVPKISPRSEAKDSGFCSEVQRKESPSELIEEPQDTMAEIDDISDEDSNEIPVVYADSRNPLFNQLFNRPRTVAERLGGAFRLQKEANEQYNKPLVAGQMSTGSSTNDTASTASTDDTTLQHTVRVQEPVLDTKELITGDHIGEDSEKLSEKSLHKTDNCSDDGNSAFEPLSSTRSLLSRVAFNAEEDECSVEEVPPKKIGDLSVIALTSQSRESKSDMISTIESTLVVSEDKIKFDADQEGAVTKESEVTVSEANNTPDVSQIDPEPDNSNVNKQSLLQSEDYEISNISVEQGNGGAERVDNAIGIEHQNTSLVHNNSDTSSDTSPLAQNITDSSRSVIASTMYTESTDIDKYMADSLESDTIKSSITTLPRILEDSLTVSEVSRSVTPTLESNPSTMIKESSPDAKLSATIPQATANEPHTVGEKLDASIRSEPPKPFVSLSSPVKKEHEAKEKIVRRGSYTLDSPSPALLAAQLAENSDMGKQRPKSSLGITQPNSRNNGRDQMNQSQVQSEPTRMMQYELTSSMEDLKLKPVKKTLNFDDDSESNHTHTLSEKNSHIPEHDHGEVPFQPVSIGKEEHLRRYLQTLSQMPQLPPTGTSVSEGGSVRSSPGERFSQTNSPGQVNSTHMNQLGPLSDTETSINRFTEDSLSQSLQREFEQVQGKLLEQQQQQLAQLLHEQQRQQMVMQQEFLKHESMLLQSSATEDDILLHQQLQDKQRELLQQQMAMQQQMRWQMQQQQLQLQAHLIELKQSHVLKKEVDTRSEPSKASSMALEKKAMRKKWQGHQDPCDWVIEAQSETESVMSENDPEGVRIEGKSSKPSKPTQHRFFPAIDNEGEAPQKSTDTTTSTVHSQTSRNINRSGVSIGSEAFSTLYSESGMSTNTDSHGHKKRVSFSTDIDAASEVGSVTSQSLTSRSTSRSGMATEPHMAGHYRVGGQYFPVPNIEPLMETAESGDTSLLNSVASSPSRLASAGYFQSPVSAGLASRISKSNRGSPKSPRHMMLSGPKFTINDMIPPEMQKKFEKVSAAAKGYLTRRLMHSDKVGQIIKTITDTAEFAINFQQESALKQGPCTNQDRELVERVLAQLTSALYGIHEIFFEIPKAEQMSLIAQTRAMEREKFFKQKEAKRKSKRLSSATMKALERKKKALAAEKAVFGDLRPKSAPPSASSPVADKHPDLSGPLRRNYQYMMSRVLKPIQAHLSPIKPVKDTLKRNPLRSSYDKLYTRALKRAVAMEKKEQREKVAHKHKFINTKNVKPKVNSHLTSKKPNQVNNINNSTASSSPKRPPSNPRPKSAQQTYPWK